MKYVTILMLFGFWCSVYSQDVSTDTYECDWYAEILNSTDRAFRLQMAKKNFREHTSIDKDDPCNILYLLAVNEQYFMLSNDTAVGFFYPDEMINAIKLEELDTLVAFNKKEIETLYGPTIGGVILIQSSSVEYERRIDSIWSQKK